MYKKINSIAITCAMMFIICASSIAMSSEQLDSNGKSKYEVIGNYVTTELLSKTSVIISYIEIASQSQPIRQVIADLIKKSKISKNARDFMNRELASGGLDSAENLRQILLQANQESVSPLFEVAFSNLTKKL